MTDQSSAERVARAIWYVAQYIVESNADSPEVARRRFNIVDGTILLKPNRSLAVTDVLPRSDESVPVARARFDAYIADMISIGEVDVARWHAIADGIALRGADPAWDDLLLALPEKQLSVPVIAALVLYRDAKDFAEGGAECRATIMRAVPRLRLTLDGGEVIERRAARTALHRVVTQALPVAFYFAGKPEVSAIFAQVEEQMLDARRALHLRSVMPPREAFVKHPNHVVAVRLAVDALGAFAAGKWLDVAHASMGAVVATFLNAVESLKLLQALLNHYQRIVVVDRMPS